MNRILTGLILCAASLTLSGNALAAKLIKPTTAARLIRADAKQLHPSVKRWSIKLDAKRFQGSTWFTAKEIMPKSSMLPVMPAEVNGVINLNKSFQGPRIRYPERTYR